MHAEERAPPERLAGLVSRSSEAFIASGRGWNDMAQSHRAGGQKNRTGETRERRGVKSSDHQDGGSVGGPATGGLRGPLVQHARTLQAVANQERAALLEDAQQEPVRGPAADIY